MWPLTSQTFLDQAITQALPQQNMQFGAMQGPLRQDTQQAPQEQTGVNRILNNPQLLNAFARMGNAITMANSQGAGFGASLAAGSNAFLDERQRQEEAAIAKRRSDAQADAYDASAARDRKDAEFGVKSSGFEGDIARARVVLADPMATSQQKAIAQAIVDTAQRAVGAYDPVTGDYRWNPKTQLPGSPASAPSSSQESSMPPPLATGNGDMLLPPPSEGGSPDASLFQSTGNRKVDAALMQKAGEAQIQRQQEKQASLPQAVAQGNYMLSVIDQAMNSPGLAESVGGPLGMTGRVAQNYPLTQGQRDFQPIAEQLRGSTFLQAYNDLKGGGQITEVEGKKAESAIARLQQYQSEASYLSALKELREVVAAGIDRARSGATQTPAQQAASVPATATPQPKRLRYNPQTGNLE